MIIAITFITAVIICILLVAILCQYFVIKNERRVMNQLIESVRKMNRYEIGYIDIKKEGGTYIIEEIVYHPEKEPAEINEL